MEVSISEFVCVHHGMAGQLFLKSVPMISPPHFIGHLRIFMPFEVCRMLTAKRERLIFDSLLESSFASGCPSTVLSILLDDDSDDDEYQATTSAM